jgi:hypothetical protein
MKIRSFTTQTRFQSERNGFLRKTEEKSSEGCQKEERTIVGGGGMMYWCMEASPDFHLEFQSNVEIQPSD